MMNVDEVKAAKAEAEGELGALLHKLQEKTGCDVVGVTLYSTHPIAGRSRHAVEIDLRVPR